MLASARSLVLFVGDQKNLQQMLYHIMMVMILIAVPVVQVPVHPGFNISCVVSFIYLYLYLVDIMKVLEL